MDRDRLEDEYGWRPCGSGNLREACWILCACYCLVAFLALVQRVRLQLLSGGSMQKLFHALLMGHSAIRAVFFGLVAGYGLGSFPGGTPFNFLLNILPDSLFFTTFCLLVMFWANIYHKAKNRPVEFLKRVRIGLKAANVVVYLVQLVFWLLLSFYAPKLVDKDRDMLSLLFHIQVIVLCVLTTIGFILYGGSLFVLLRGFPIQSNKQQRLLREVGLVTCICCATFSIRAGFVCLLISRPHDSDYSFFVCMAYFLAVEVLPSTLVLFILRHMPENGIVHSDMLSRISKSLKRLFIRESDRRYSQFTSSVGTVNNGAV